MPRSHAGTPGSFDHAPRGASSAAVTKRTGNGSFARLGKRVFNVSVDWTRSFRAPVILSTNLDVKGRGSAGDPGTGDVLRKTAGLLLENALRPGVNDFDTSPATDLGSGLGSIRVHGTTLTVDSAARSELSPVSLPAARTWNRLLEPTDNADRGTATRRANWEASAGFPLLRG